MPASRCSAWIIAPTAPPRRLRKPALAVKKINLARVESLLPIKAVSQQEVDLARATLRQAEAQLSRARLDLENTTVPAPISGHIGRALVTEGALVGRGDATLLATIEQLEPVDVLFTQPNADVLRLRSAPWPPGR